MHQALQAHKVLWVTQDSLVQLDKREHVVCLVPQALTASQARSASLDLLELVALRVPTDSQVSSVQVVNWVSQVPRVTLAGLVQLASLAQSAHVGLLAHRDQMVKPVHLANRDLKALQAQLASLECRADPDSPDSKVQLETPAIQVR